MNCLSLRLANKIEKFVLMPAESSSFQINKADGLSRSNSVDLSLRKSSEGSTGEPGGRDSDDKKPKKRNWFFWQRKKKSVAS